MVSVSKTTVEKLRRIHTVAHDRLLVNDTCLPYGLIMILSLSTDNESPSFSVYINKWSGIREICL